MQIRPVFHADGRTDMTKLTVAFLSFANAHLNRCSSNKFEILAVGLAGCDDAYFAEDYINLR